MKIPRKSRCSMIISYWKMKMLRENVSRLLQEQTRSHALEAAGTPVRQVSFYHGLTC